jgi:hypothetical protein
MEGADRAAAAHARFRRDRADILSSSCLCPIVEVRPGAFFFRENDAADSMFVLEAGKVAVLKSWRNEEYLLHTLGPGDCFGEMALMDLMPRSASVRAIEDCAGRSSSPPRTCTRSTRRTSAVRHDPDEHGAKVSRRLGNRRAPLPREDGMPDADEQHLFHTG